MLFFFIVRSKPRSKCFPYTTLFRCAENVRRDRDNFTDTTTTGDYNQFWYDRGTELLDDGRTSLITDPPNGRIPELTEAAQARNEARREAARLAEGVEVRPLSERCIMGFRSEEHTSELQSRRNLVCRLLLEKKKKK